MLKPVLKDNCGKNSGGLATGNQPVRDRSFCLSSKTEVKFFPEGALLLALKGQPRLFHLNRLESLILSGLDNYQNAKDIAPSIAEAFDLTPEEALLEVVAFSSKLVGAEILQEESSTLTRQGNEGDKMSAKYIKNPDIVLREEDEGGALLFDPDTGAVRLLNLTGLAIWKLCDGKHDLENITEKLRQSFDGAPEDELRSNVVEFIDSMINDGFLGVEQPLPIG
jgi:hypothetical protein